jgi:hypothetical protein
MPGRQGTENSSLRDLEQGERKKEEEETLDACFRVGDSKGEKESNLY